jgi:hypothetical protein
MDQAIARLLSHASIWGADQFVALADVFCAASKEGDGQVPSRSSPFALAVRALAYSWRPGASDPTSAFATFDDLEGDEATALLEQADQVIAPTWAPALADELARRGVLPSGVRLAALLAVQDEARCAALLERLGAGRTLPPERWVRSAAEALLAAEDSLLPPGPALRAFAAYLEGADPFAGATAAIYTARLRRAARISPSAALALLNEAVLNVGHYEVEEGLAAVLGRLGRVDPVSAQDYIAARATAREHRALALRYIAEYAGPGAWTIAALSGLRQELAAICGGAPAEPGEGYSLTFELLAAFAALGCADLAADIIRLAGPPLWLVFSATWAPARRAALAGRPAPPDLWPQLQAAVFATGEGVAAAEAPFAPPWAELAPGQLGDLWSFKARPSAVTPWWTAWGAGPP